MLQTVSSSSKYSVTQINIESTLTANPVQRILPALQHSNLSLNNRYLAPLLSNTSMPITSNQTRIMISVVQLAVYRFEDACLSWTDQFVAELDGKDPEDCDGGYKEGRGFLGSWSDPIGLLEFDGRS